MTVYALAVTADPARISVTAKVSAYYRKLSDIAFAEEAAKLIGADEAFAEIVDLARTVVLDHPRARLVARRHRTDAHDVARVDHGEHTGEGLTFAVYTRDVNMLRSARSFILGIALACTSIGCVSKPTMHLNHAEISGFQAATYPPSIGVLMTVVVDVYNPNGYDVAIRAMRGQVIMADRYPLALDYRAPTADGVWLASNRTTSVRVPITMPLDLAIALVREGMSMPTIPFRVIGKADVTGTRTLQIERDDYSVDERGAVTREQMLAVIPSSLFPH